MMKMASGDDLPLRQGAGTGSRLIFVATEACSGGTSDLGLFRGVSVFIGPFGVGLMSRWASRCSLLIMVAPGMMKMASGDDFTLPQSAKTGSGLFFCGYKGLRWRNF